MQRRFKHLKIVEQIAIVLVFSVVIPLFVIAIIINNINQQGIRKELRQQASMTAEILAQRVNSLSQHITSGLEDVVLSLEYMPTAKDKINYLEGLEKRAKSFQTLSIEDTPYLEIDNKISYSLSNDGVTTYTQLSPNKSLKVVYNKDFFENELLQNFENDERQFYILSNDGKLLVSHNFNERDFAKTYSLLPKKLSNDRAEIFGDVKNQPLAYYKMTNPDILILVNTTAKVTKTTITKASIRIFLSFFLASCAILFIVGLYMYYLYINIRQLFKGLMAVTKGNYKRKIRLLVSIFTPHEILFIASEFNKMVKEINKSYRELKQKNIELKKLDEFRSNLIDTVSHEFRTPLTSIQGYTSRLLRQDIEIDEETKLKSLKIIKRQSERLSRMVEDLLAIPDIEGANFKIDVEKISLSEIFEISVAAVSNDSNSRFNVEIQEGISSVIANKDKLEQVIINVLENALKYADEDSQISLTARKNRNNIIIAVENKADYIPKEILSHLFEKFTRVDDKTTRETRGTGLGLYIVKATVKAMNGSVDIYSSIDRTFKIEIKLKGGDNE